MTEAAIHARQTIMIALIQGEKGLTAGELRNCIRRLYGPAVDEELDSHFHPSTRKETEPS